MTPGAHLISSWILATACGCPTRERRLVSLAGVIPDLDGLGIVADVLTRDRTSLYETYHHVLGHNLAFGMLISMTFAALSPTRKVRVLLLSALAFHLHLLGDLVGSRGPDGFQWPIPYLAPFSHSVQLTWQGQWLLNGWQNNTILAALVLGSLRVAATRGHSFVEVISTKLDRRLFEMIRPRGSA
ncbi:MAG TPA: metal-dependent hydrolase [Holophagaceae bacterium]|nr:metal-dependent hydrolase [Holophagaceae bacterium]